MAALDPEVTRLQAENDRLRLALTDFSERIVCGRLTGELPDNFLEQFSQLPDRPLEHVLRFLPAQQVPQMRHVSRKFNHLIRKCSKTMPKMKRDGSVVFRNNNAGELTVDWFDDCGSKITTTTTSLAGDEVALSELLRFIRIGGRMFFGEGVSAADEVLNQLSKAWLTIHPEVVIFSSDLSHTSQDSLRAFLVKVEPSIRRLNFQNVTNITDSLLSDDLIGAAGRLDGLMVLPMCWGSELRDSNVVSDNNIGDNTLLSMADAGRVSSYFFVMGCSGITPGGIRAFVEKWMKKERPQVDANFSGFGWPLELCELTFYKCANVTAAAVEEACGDLLKKETIAGADVFVGDSGEMQERVRYTSQCSSSNCRLEILFHYYPFHSHFVNEPRLDEEIDYNYDDDYHDDLDPEIEDDDFDDYDGYDAIDYDDDEDTDLD